MFFLRIYFIFWEFSHEKNVSYGYEPVGLQEAQILEKVLDSYVLDTTAESQGHDEVQEALMIRSALAAGTFDWTTEGVAVLKESTAVSDDELCAATLRLDDFHSPQDREKS